MCVCVLDSQLCLTLWHLMNCSPLGSSVHGILQARILEWVALPSPGHLSNSGIERGSPAMQADSLPSEPPGKLKKCLVEEKRANLKERNYALFSLKKFYAGHKYSTIHQ